MAFRRTLSSVINDDQSVAESTLEALISINNQPIGRAQGLRHSMQANARPINEIGSDKSVEILPGIKGFQGTIQSITIRYGDLAKRLASVAGGQIDAMSKASTVTNLPPFDIVVNRRGSPAFSSPALYNEPVESQLLAGTGEIIMVLRYCVIDSAERSFNVDQAMVMESIQFRYLDEVPGNFVSSEKTLNTVIS